MQSYSNRKIFLLKIHNKEKGIIKKIPFIEGYYIYKNAPYVSVEVKNTLVKNFLKEIQKTKNITGIQEDGVKKLFYTVPDDPLFYDQWYADFLGLPYLWDEVKNSSSQLNIPEETVIALIDTGVDLDHPELKDAFWVNKMEIPGNGVDDDANGYIDDINGINSDCPRCKKQSIEASECSNHGTFMAGVIAAKKDNGIGIAGIGPSNVKILICKAGTDSGMPNSSVFRAMDYLIEMKKRGVNIVAVNMSYGGEEKSDLEKHLLEELEANEIIPIIAAGNEDKNLDLHHIYPASYKLDNSIVVGSIGPNGKKSSFSNYGFNTINIFAPGESILTTAYVYGEHGYGITDGTSISTPMVAAGIAYLYELFPNYSAFKLKEKLIEKSTFSLPLVRYEKSGRILDFKKIYEK
jgi:subtilisin family serine protease